MLFAIWEVHIQGSYGSWKTWKVLEFYYDISRTGKSWKKAAGPGKFGNLLNATKKYELYGRQ